jgi:uncharacterized SAM-binding protein YcdF (DUF218 family)
MTSLTSRRRRWLRRLLLLVVLVLGLYFTRAWYLPAVGRFLDVSDPPRQTDCVFILGGEANTRPFVGAALIRTGRARRVVFVPVKAAPAVQDGLWPADHELTRRVLLARGVDPAAIVLLPAEADSTQDEAVALGKFLEAEPDVTVAVVTSDYHTRRTRLLMRRALGPNQDRIHFVAAPVDGVRAETWWQSRKGFVMYINEYCKLIMYTLRR